MDRRNLLLTTVKTALLTAFGVVTEATAQTIRSSPPGEFLPSWNDTDSKNAILAFVDRVTRQGSPDFVPKPKRVAAFDNDGTLWAEQPLYSQLLFALDRVKVLAPQHPEWKTTEPFASLLRGDVKGVLAGGEKAIAPIVIATHSGMTSEEFNQVVLDWITAAKHPVTKRLYTEMVYQPMLELVVYLQVHDFKTFIASGVVPISCGRGRREFMAFRLKTSLAAVAKPSSNCGTASRCSYVCRKSTSSTTALENLSASTST
jgi:hypothetical protein